MGLSMELDGNDVQMWPVMAYSPVNIHGAGNDSMELEMSMFMGMLMGMGWEGG